MRGPASAAPGNTCNHTVPVPISQPVDPPILHRSLQAQEAEKGSNILTACRDLQAVVQRQCPDWDPLMVRLGCAALASFRLMA
jgi:hypothetical protein